MTDQSLEIKALSAGSEGIPHPGWLASPAGDSVYFNRLWQDLTGLGPEESVRQGWMSALLPEDRSRVSESWHRAVSTLSPFEIEARIRRAPDGNYSWMILKAAPLREA